eukprot:826215-Amphidinium_carterae.2
MGQKANKCKTSTAMNQMGNTERTLGSVLIEFLVSKKSADSRTMKKPSRNTKTQKCRRRIIRASLHRAMSEGGKCLTQMLKVTVTVKT